jgi:hypothetical protein
MGAQRDRTSAVHRLWLSLEAFVHLKSGEDLLLEIIYIYIHFNSVI